MYYFVLYFIISFSLILHSLLIFKILVTSVRIQTNYIGGKIINQGQGLCVPSYTIEKLQNS